MIRLEIWSDIVCPFCYIGKRHLEAALSHFEHREEVEVIWKSFELDPGAERTSNADVYEMLSKKYRRDLAWARQTIEQVARSAAEAGLQLDFDRTVMTNSFDGHRLIHLAARDALQDRAAERLFAAHFTEGKNIGDPDTLLRLGVEIGLDAETVRKMLAADQHASDVRRDEEEAYSLGVRGVPFFLFNGRHVLSGAQPVGAFKKALDVAWDVASGRPES